MKVNEWLELREIRNQFAHDYPDDPQLQAGMLNKAMQQSSRLLQVLASVNAFATRYQQP